MSVKEEIHSQIVGGFADATFPINRPEDLLEDLILMLILPD